jgi:hypothetical protein
MTPPDADPPRTSTKALTKRESIAESQHHFRDVGRHDIVDGTKVAAAKYISTL